MDGRRSKSDDRHRSRRHGHRPQETRVEVPNRRYSKPTDKQPRKKTRPDLGPDFKQFKSTKLPKHYSKGYHALLSVIKDLKNLRERPTEFEPEPPPPYKGRTRKDSSVSRASRRSQSYIRGKSVYFDEAGSLIPYYRSKSVDRGREYSFSSTHEPVVNEHDVIYLTYTGRTSRPTSAESRKSRARSRRGSGIVQKRVEAIPPHRRNSFTYDDLHYQIIDQIKDAYGRSGVDIKQKQFFQTLALIQMEHNKMKKMNLSKSDRQFLEKTFAEVKSLKSESNKILKDANKRYESQYESPSPNKDIRKLTSNRKPLDDMYLQRQRTRGRLKLKPLGSNNRSQDMDRIVSHDFYTRRRNADWRYDMHKQQSRQYFKFEPNRTSGVAGTGGGGSTSRQPNTARSLKPITRPQFQARIYHNNKGPTTWVPQKDYRHAKQRLMYSNRPVKQQNTPVVRDSPATLAMKQTVYRHRMHGVAK